MLTTKFTHIYRILGALGCGLVIIGIMLPWATVTDGKIATFENGASPSGWDLAWSQKNIGANLNAAGAIFTAVFMMMPFAIFGIIVNILGRNGVSFGYFLLSSTIFFLIFMLVLLPYVQSGIPTPPDPMTPDKLTELEQLNQTDAAAGSKAYSEMMKLKDQRDDIMAWKNLKMVPQFGMFLTLTGAIMAWVVAKMIVADSARIENYNRYAVLLSQVHKDGKVTKDEAEILAKERYLLRINKEEQTMIIRKTVADPTMQERLIAMHEKPIDIEQMMRNREFESYKKTLVTAYKDGKLTADEAALLKAQREGLGISDEDHDAMYNELVERGDIRPGKHGPVPDIEDAEGDIDDEQPPAPSKPVTVVPSRSPGIPAPLPVPAPPSAVREQSPPLNEPLSPSGPTAPPSSGPLMFSPMGGKPPVPPPGLSTPPGATSAPPLPGNPPPVPPQVPGPMPPPVPGPEPEETKIPLKTVRCSKCGETINIYTDERPLQLVCPKCGFTGTLKK